MNWGVEACKVLASVNDSQCFALFVNWFGLLGTLGVSHESHTRQIEELYPDGRTPWRYPNSGGLVGPLQAKGMPWAVGTCLSISSRYQRVDITGSSMPLCSALLWEVMLELLHALVHDTDIWERFFSDWAWHVAGGLRKNKTQSFHLKPLVKLDLVSSIRCISSTRLDHLLIFFVLHRFMAFVNQVSLVVCGGFCWVVSTSWRFTNPRPASCHLWCFGIPQ